MSNLLMSILNDLGYFNPWEGCVGVSEGCDNCPSKNTFKSFALTGDVINCTENFVFICNHSELFNQEVDTYRSIVWDVIRHTDKHFLIVTKRPERILDSLPDYWDCIKMKVSFAVSVERQQYLHRLDDLVKVDCFARYLFLCPLLERIELPLLGWLDGVCVSQENGKACRPFEMEWFYSVKEIYPNAIFRGNGGRIYV